MLLALVSIGIAITEKICLPGLLHPTNMYYNARVFIWGNTMELRHRYALLKAYWEGEVSRKDVIEHFSISSAQATNDFADIKRLYPHCLEYNGSRRRYVPSSQLSKWVNNESFDEYQHVIGEHEGGVYRVKHSHHPVNVTIYRTLTQAIKNQRGVKVTYTSLHSPAKDKDRILYPHTLINTQFRWHVRAMDKGDGQFKDFNLSRISRCQLTDEPTPESALASCDENWMTPITVILIPNPSLSLEERSVIQDEFGMEKNMLTIESTPALLLYTLHHYQVFDFSLKPHKHQLLAVGNREYLSLYHLE